MKSGIKLSVAALVLSMGLLAQNANNQESKGRQCATPAPGENWDIWFNAKVKEFEQQAAQGNSKAAPYIIPVVVHVIHGGQNVGTFPNIGLAQINSQIGILNSDFAGTGYGVSSLPSVFSSLVANTNISFCMAKLDPDGYCLTEPGVHRVDYHSINGATNPSAISDVPNLQSMFDNVIKPATIWDPVRYLNIWVSDVGAAAQVLGYASFPLGSGLSGLPGAGTANTDGVWVWSRAYGNTGFAQFPYNRGRTATHEIGHWLGLRHTWGDGTCATDYCNDTPPAQSSNSGCPSHPLNVGLCSGNTTGEMFQNFMDYSDDACLALFTTDQNSRIQTAMINGTYRKQLTASAATLCSIPGAAPQALFSLSTNSVCADSIILASNMSTGGPCPAYSWSLTPSFGFSFVPSSASVSADPSIKFFSPGAYTITLVATNSLGTSSLIDYIDVYDCNDAVGITKNTFSDAGVKLVPNPSSGEVNIISNYKGNADIAVTVFDALGQQVFKRVLSGSVSSNTRLDLSGYENGIYFVSIETNNGKAVKRLLINK